MNRRQGDTYDRDSAPAAEDFIHWTSRQEAERYGRDQHRFRLEEERLPRSPASARGSWASSRVADTYRPVYEHERLPRRSRSPSPAAGPRPTRDRSPVRPPVGRERTGAPPWVRPDFVRRSMSERAGVTRIEQDSSGQVRVMNEHWGIMSNSQKRKHRRKVLQEVQNPERYPNSRIPSTQARNRGERKDN